MTTNDILIVDDTPANLRLLTEVLQSAGFKVRAVLDGSMAITAVKTALPSLILLDIGLPIMNGYEVCRRIKSDEATSGVPIIFISALDSVDDKVKALTEGGVDYITKPFQAVEVLARVRLHTELARMRSELQMANVELERQVEERTSALRKTNEALASFVPEGLLGLLGRKSVLDTNLGDSQLLDAAVMFCDIRGFTKRSEVLGPRETFAFLNRYFGMVVPAIQENGGILDTFLGDGLLALFPGSSTAPLIAAKKIIQAVTALNQELLSEGLETVQVGIGLNRGSCMLGIIGHRDRFQGTVIADAVNLASRIESLTKSYGVSILASDTLFVEDLTNQNFPHRWVDRVAVRGRVEPVELFQLFAQENPNTIELRQKAEPTYRQIMKLLATGEDKKAKELVKDLLQQDPEDPLLLRLQNNGF